MRVVCGVRAVCVVSSSTIHRNTARPSHAKPLCPEHVLSQGHAPPHTLHDATNLKTVIAGQPRAEQSRAGGRAGGWGRIIPCLARDVCPVRSGMMRVGVGYCRVWCLAVTRPLPHCPGPWWGCAVLRRGYWQRPGWVLVLVMLVVGLAHSLTVCESVYARSKGGVHGVHGVYDMVCAVCCVLCAVLRVPTNATARRVTIKSNDKTT